MHNHRVHITAQLLTKVAIILCKSSLLIDEWYGMKCISEYRKHRAHGPDQSKPNQTPQKQVQNHSHLIKHIDGRAIWKSDQVL